MSTGLDSGRDRGRNSGRDSGRDSAPARTDDLLASGRIATYAVLIVLAIIAWWVSDLRMSGMDAGPASPLGTFSFFMITWVVMMSAMMFPSVAPMVATFVSIQRGRRRKSMPTQSGATALFLSGYVLTWAAFGLVAYLAARLATAVNGFGVSWAHRGHWIAAGLLIAAAGYEATPLKAACLTRCRGPLSFILSNWRDGRIGALQMGIRHGAWCVGCCWGLMVALFTLGVMSLAWMTLIGALIAIEKLLPWRRTGMSLVGAVLAALAIGIAVAPSHVPGLVQPGSDTTMMN